MSESAHYAPFVSEENLKLLTEISILLIWREGVSEIKFFLLFFWSFQISIEQYRR